MGLGRMAFWVEFLALGGASVKVEMPGTLADFEKQIMESIGKPRFDLWFAGHTKLSLQDGVLQIGVPNRFYREWLESHFSEEIRACLLRVFAEPMEVRFRIDPTLFQQSYQRLTDAADSDANVAGNGQANGSGHLTQGRALTANPLDARHGLLSPANLPPIVRKPSRFALAKFVVGTPNRVAHAAVSSLVDDVRAGYSPLLIHAGIGLGKTHLVRGLADELRQRQPGLKVMVVSCEEFTNQFVDAMRTGKLNSFRRKVRHLDVLIVDDVQFLANKRATQEEFLHTLNSLQNRNAKVVLTCDCHPRRLTKLSEELRSRFVSGMVAKIDPPNHDMRRQIVVDKAARRQMELARDVVDLLADNLRSNICELEGAVNYLEHYSETLDRPLDAVTARNALSEVFRHSSPMLQVGEIRKRFCDLFGIAPRILRQRTRTRSVSHPRMLLLYLTRKYTRATYSEIGQEIGGLNHSTVIAAEKRILAMIEKDSEILLGDRPMKVRDALDSFERDLG